MIEDVTSAALLSWLASPPARSKLAGFRLLCAAPEEPSWIRLSLQLDAIGCHDARLKWVSAATEAMTLLRHEVFDAIVVQHNQQRSDWDTGNFIRAIRASGCDDAILVLTAMPDDSLVVIAADEQAEVLVTRLLWDSPALLPSVQRAMQTVELRRENHRLSVANQRRLVRERDEADHLLQQQHDIIRELQLLGNELDLDSDLADSEPAERSRAAALLATNGTSRNIVPADVPAEIKHFYQELLRTYVIMGSGGLGTEILQLAKVLAQVGLSPRDTLALHLERVESLVKGLGNRSTRHVMARADLLVLELIMHIGECYQQAGKDAQHGSRSAVDQL